MCRWLPTLRALFVSTADRPQTPAVTTGAVSLVLRQGVPGPGTGSHSAPDARLARAQRLTLTVFSRKGHGQSGGPGWPQGSSLQVTDWDPGPWHPPAPEPWCLEQGGPGQSEQLQPGSPRVSAAYARSPRLQRMWPFPWSPGHRNGPGLVRARAQAADQSRGRAQGQLPLSCTVPVLPHPDPCWAHPFL